MSCLSGVKVETTKLVGVTTDGENANTGKNGGLWKLLREHTGRDILTAWCVCRCSDLALESQIPELSIWMSNVFAVSTFFRTSPRQTKLLHKVQLICLYINTIILDNWRMLNAVRKERNAFYFKCYEHNYSSMLVTTCKPLILHFICKQLTQYLTHARFC